MLVDFTARELEYLTALLERDEHALDFEISRTDHREFRKMLRERQKLCEEMLHKVARQTATAA